MKQTGFISTLCLAWFVVVTSFAAAQVCHETYKVTSSAGGSRGGSSGLGIAAAAGDGVIVVGDLDSPRGATNGSVWIYNAETGTLIRWLHPTDGTWMDHFGRAIDVRDGLLAVGAPGDHRQADEAGSVYLFQVGTWSQQAKFYTNSGVTRQHFGSSVAMGDGLLVSGAPGDSFRGDQGRAYIFDLTTYEQRSVLVPLDAAGGAEFGFAVDISHGVIAIGAPGDNPRGSNSGSVYLFDAATGVELAKIIPDDVSGGDRFGTSVAVANGLIVAGAPGDDGDGNASGVVYVFDLATQTQVALLASADRQQGDEFGHALDVSGEVLVVGAPRESSYADDSGSAYLFHLGSGTQLAKIQASDGTARDYFGEAVGIDGGVAVAGARADTIQGEIVGSAYVYHIDDCPSLVLDVTNTACPAAGPTTLTATGGSGGPVGFVYTTNGLGHYSVPRGEPCGRLAFNLARPVMLAGVASGDPAVLEISNVPMDACGGVMIQAVDMVRCTTSNVVTLE